MSNPALAGLVVTLAGALLHHSIRLAKIETVLGVIREDIKELKDRE